MVLALLAWTLATASGGGAQELQDLKKPATPLVLQSQGSFIVGGDIVSSDALGSGGSGHIAVNQMYVQYKVPPSSRVPVVMVHGADLSGKSYETTPDGRMGWEEYFVRKGHAVYLADQVSRARSGFDPTVFNRVHAGVALPSAQLLISHLPLFPQGIRPTLTFGYFAVNASAIASAGLTPGCSSRETAST